jgi:hypothetical protein
MHVRRRSADPTVLPAVLANAKERASDASLAIIDRLMKHGPVCCCDYVLSLDENKSIVVMQAKNVSAIDKEEAEQKATLAAATDAKGR